jgi:hypothetical protein
MAPENPPRESPQEFSQSKVRGTVNCGSWASRWVQVVYPNLYPAAATAFTAAVSNTPLG